MRLTGLHSTYEILSNNSLVTKPIATLVFDDDCQNLLDSDIVSTGLKGLSPEECKEYFHGDTTFTQTDLPNGWIKTSDQWLFAALWLDETRYASLEVATEAAYQQLLSATQEQGFQHWVRVWNYLERINEDDLNLERYRRFCVGRYKAFKAHGVDEKRFPSACALGHAGGGLLVYLLAAKEEPKHFENPVQISAYEYPAEYGPKSPSFARATLAANGGGYSLYLSGTASVVGHATQFPFELVPQIQTTLQNIDLMLAHVAATASDYTGIHSPHLSLQVLKVYIRHSKDLETIKAQVDQHFKSDSILYVQADICRADLLLEIDGVWGLSE